MTRRRDRRAYKVGLFVAVAAGLGVAALVLLGAGAFARERVRVETYFTESVHGLSVGSPVKLRGVKIGVVEQITFSRIKYHVDPLEPAAVEWSNKVVVVAGLKPDTFPESAHLNVAALMAEQVEEGLRFQLALEGISGLLYLEADYWPDKTATALQPPWTPEEVYVPGIESTITQISTSLQQFLAKVETIDIESLSRNLDDLLAGAASFVRELDGGPLAEDAAAILADLRTSTELLRKVLTEADQSGLIARADGTLAATADLLRSTERGVAETLDEAKALIARVDGLLTDERVQASLDKLAAASVHVEESSREFPALVRTAERSLSRADLLLANRERDFDLLLANLRSLSGSLDRALADLAQQPSRVLFGAPPPPSRPYER